MKMHRYVAAIAASMLLGTASQSQALTLIIIDDCEGYTDGVGSWVAEAAGISVALGLNIGDAIEGTKDLVQTLGGNLLGGSYTITNANLNTNVPVGALNFSFKHKALIGLSVNKTVVVTLTDQDNVEYVSPETPMNLLTLNTTVQYDIPLADFTPPADGGVISVLKGVKMDFSATTGLEAEEHLDSFGINLEEASVTDWSCY